MIEDEHVQGLLDAFDVQGFVRVEPDDASTDWVAEARIKADQAVNSGKPKEDGWYDLTLELAMPRNKQLLHLLKALLVRELSLPPSAQLSTLVNGFDRQSTSHHRHVDGYYKPEGEDKEVLAWHALLIGVLIDTVPEEGDVGSPVVWPGSQRLTRKAFESIDGDDLTADAVGREILLQPSRAKPMQHLRLHGKAGTIFVIDHGLHHGMLPHRTPSFRRHIAYYRVPEKTSNPAHVANVSHFFRKR